MGRKKTFLLLVMVVLTLGAGVELGWVWTPLRRASASESNAHTAGPRPWFDQLDLSADQQKQMDKIWSDTRGQMQKLFEHHLDLDKQRDQAVLALLNPDQRAAFDKINQDFHAQREDLDKQRQALFADANTRSRALLDDSQKKNWDILTKQFQTRHRHGPMGLATQSSTMSSYDEGHHD
jgi:hypothetical protein